MAAITNYSTLLTEVANWLNRDDLTADIPGFVQNGEARLKRDFRAKLLVDASPLSVTATETLALPSDLDSIQALAHNGPTFYGEIEIVDPGKLSEFGSRFPNPGVPRAASIGESGLNINIRWAPTPDTTYSLLFQYWAKLTALSLANPTNRFILAHPDIYLYAALAETPLFLKDDERAEAWEKALNQRLEDLHLSTQRRAYSGSLVRQPTNPIP